MAFNFIRISRLHKWYYIQINHNTGCIRYNQRSQVLTKEVYLNSEGNNNNTITVQEIAHNNKQIAELFDALRKGMQPESPNLPFKVKDREKTFRAASKIQER